MEFRLDGVFKIEVSDSNYCGGWFGRIMSRAVPGWNRGEGAGQCAVDDGMAYRATDLGDHLDG